MRTPLLLSFLFTAAAAFSQLPADSTIKRLGIPKIIYTIKTPSQRFIVTNLYDREGRLVQSQTIEQASFEKNITYYTYSKGLLVTESTESYYKNKRYEVQKTNYRYDTKSRLISKAWLLDDKRIFKDTVIYDSQSQTDTTYSFSNDTMIYNAKRKLNLLAAAGTFHPESITINYYDSRGNKTGQVLFSARDRKRCMNIDRSSVTDSTGYIITGYYAIGDTSVEKATAWLCRKEKQINTRKWVTVSKNETYQEEAGETTRTTDSFNKLNLVSSRTIIRTDSVNNSRNETTMTFRYYFRQRK